ncbi:TspO/MBR family protein [Dokdonella sp. MW10]|uniref:TspO/MBR family protein n=1 Tax=Dokdonella sp. MW10 TaxID=2992926 RepID=UPI003F7DAD43
MRGWKGFLVFLALVAVAAAFGSLSRPDEWYRALVKPSFNPPDALFAPVWTILYAAIAVAGWRVYRRVGWDYSLGLWGIQLALNAAWTPLFFGAHRIDLALVDIALLDVFVVATLVAFFRRDRIAAWLLVPYLGWIAFATLLTATLLRLNPQA